MAAGTDGPSLRVRLEEAKTILEERLAEVNAAIGFLEKDAAGAEALMRFIEKGFRGVSR